jgi:diguanylate cyclase (GGDEF)-like protein
MVSPRERRAARAADDVPTVAASAVATAGALWCTLAGVVTLLTPGPVHPAVAATPFVAATLLAAASLVPPGRLASALPRGLRPAEGVLAVVVAVGVALLLGTGHAAHSASLVLAVAASGSVAPTGRRLAASIGLPVLAWAAAVPLVPALAFPLPVTLYALALAAAAGLSVWTWTDRSLLTRAVLEARAAAVRGAMNDPATGLASRRALRAQGRQALETARRTGQALHCVVVDVDGLDRVAAGAGSDAVDGVLRAVGQALLDSSRGTDVVARWGATSLVVVGPGQGLSPREVQRRVRLRLAQAPPVPRSLWEAEVSAGGAVLRPWDDGDLSALLADADADTRVRRALRSPSAPEVEHVVPADGAGSEVSGQ